MILGPAEEIQRDGKSFQTNQLSIQTVKDTFCQKILKTGFSVDNSASSQAGMDIQLTEGHFSSGIKIRSTPITKAQRTPFLPRPKVILIKVISKSLKYF
jgi:hypothetical protein